MKVTHTPAATLPYTQTYTTTSKLAMTHILTQTHVPTNLNTVGDTAQHMNTHTLSHIFPLSFFFKTVEMKNPCSYHKFQQCKGSKQRLGLD